MTLFQRFRSLSFILVLLLGSSVCIAKEATLGKRFRLSGFGTLALTRGGNEDLGFRRNINQEGTFDGDWSIAADSLLGLQLDILGNERFSGAVQLVGKDRIDDNLDDSLTWAFVRYRFNPDWTLRAGRIGYDLFMLSDYRDVGFAYLWTRPPTEFYTPLSFDSFDGVDLTWSTLLGEGTLRTKFMVATSSTTISVLDNPIDVELSLILGGTITWESERWQIKFSVSDNKLGDESGYFPSTEPLASILLQVAPLWPEAVAISENFKVNHPHIQYYALGAAYTNNTWQIQSELSYFDSSLNIYPPSFNGYVSVGYQIGPVTPFILASFLDAQKPRQILPESPALLDLLQQIAQTSFDSTNADQNTLSLGMRWDLRYDLALKAQWDHTWVSAYSGGMWDQRNIPTHAEELNTFSINLNFIY